MLARRYVYNIYLSLEEQRNIPTQSSFESAVLCEWNRCLPQSAHKVSTGEPHVVSQELRCHSYVVTTLAQQQRCAGKTEERTRLKIPRI